LTVCDSCSTKPADDNARFYNVRFTETGKWSDEYLKHKDLVVCQNCLAKWVLTNLDYLQSVVRIENPTIAYTEDK